MAVQECVDRVLTNAGAGIALADVVHLAHVNRDRRQFEPRLAVIVDRGDLAVEKASEPRYHYRPLIPLGLAIWLGVPVRGSAWHAVMTPTPAIAAKTSLFIPRLLGDSPWLLVLGCP